MINQRFLSLLVLHAAVFTGARAAWTGVPYTATATENLGAITVNGDATRSGGQVIDLLLSKRKHRIRNHLVFDPTTNINN